MSIKNLAEDDRPTIIAMHHPPFATGIAHMDAVGLEGAELERLVRIVIDQKVHPGIAPIAHTIEYNDVLVPGPLMGFRIKFACHWLHSR